MDREQMIENINSWVDCYCNEHNMKKEAVAKSLGIGRSTFYVKLNGKSDFSIVEAVAMSKLFKCSIDDLLGSKPSDKQSA